MSEIVMPKGFGCCSVSDRGAQSKAVEEDFGGIHHVTRLQAWNLHSPLNTCPKYLRRCNLLHHHHPSPHSRTQWRPRLLMTSRLIGSPAARMSHRLTLARERRVRGEHGSLSVGHQSQEHLLTCTGVSPVVVRALNLRGFKNPTPIQRAALPPAMADPPKDVLGMARTGSGKTLAYLIPLLQSLGGVRKESPGIRALILCPSRELAVQVLKVGKDLSRSLAGGNKSSQPLRWSIVMGGESLDAQFEAMSAKPDM